MIIFDMHILDLFFLGHSLCGFISLLNVILFGHNLFHFFIILTSIYGFYQRYLLVKSLDSFCGAIQQPLTETVNLINQIRREQRCKSPVGVADFKES